LWNFRHEAVDVLKAAGGILKIVYRRVGFFCHFRKKIGRPGGIVFVTVTLSVMLIR